MSNPICTIPQCGRKHRALGYCNRHYLKHKRFGDPLYATPRMGDSACSIDGCTEAAVNKGWCYPHYGRWLRYGSPTGTAPERAAHIPSICQVEGCTAEVAGLSLCIKHYSRLKRTGTAEANGGQRECSVDGCPRKHRAKTYCAMHLQRFYKYGEPGPAHSITWGEQRTSAPNGYVTVMRDGKRMGEHRMVIEHVIGRALIPGENVHHINGIKHDNRPENLELWVTTQPAGQRVSDQVAWAEHILTTYAPHRLSATT